MPVSATTSNAITPPRPDAMQAPANEPRKPQDYTAAKLTPKETKAATKTAFGDVPANDAAKQPIAAPKLAVTDPKSAPDPDKTTSAVDSKVQSILDAKLPDGKSVKEKLDADSSGYLVKAAQQHYDVQKQKGEPLDAASKFYLNISASVIAETGVKEESIAPEKLAGVFNTEQIKKNLEELSKDPDFAKWATEQQANSIQKTIEDNPGIAKLIDPHKMEGENYVNALRRMQSDYMTSQDFADGVVKAADGKGLVMEGMKTLTFLGLGEKELLGVGNTLAENIRSKYTPDAPKTVIDPNTNKAVPTEDGYSLGVLPDGTHVALGTDGKPVADKQGNPYVYNADRTAKVDANNAYVQYHARSKYIFANYGGIKYMVGADGKSITDTKGRPLVIDNLSGAPVALEKHGKAAVDKAGNKLVFDPNTGKALVAPDTGNAVVIDTATKAVVQTDHSGKVIAGKNGDPYAVDQKTGKFVQDAQGNTVQISKQNIAPGVLPGYVVDKNNTKMVVDPYNGKPMIDPANGKTVILHPKTNVPQLVPLDANGAPKLAADGKNIVYNETGNTVVVNEGKGPNWLVNADGNYVQNANGNYIGVDKNSGLAAPVDEKGFLKNGNGLIPLWDAKANATMTTTDGKQVATDGRGNLLMTNDKEQTFVEEKSGLPIVVDPKTNKEAVNPDTGRSLLLAKGGALVEYNADDGYQYLINPKTRTTVKTASGNPVVMSDSAGVPYAVTPDGTVVKNPATGNIVVYGTDGQPAKEATTGNYLEITANGKAYVIDPKTNAPMAYRDPKTGGYQLLNPDGSEQTNPDTGNKIQLTPGSALKVEIDAKTSKPVEDGNGNILLIGPDNRPLKTPEGNAVVADNKSGAPIAVDEHGKAINDPASHLPQVINTDTGKTVSDPKTGAAVVVDPQSGQPIQIDPKTKKPIKDPVTGLPIIANSKTGAQLHGPNGEPVVVAPGLGMPGYVDKATNTFTGYDFATGKAMINPNTGATVILDPDLGVPVDVMPDKNGNPVLVDGNGKVQTDGKGNPLLLDKDTGQVVIKKADGTLVDVSTGKAPEKVDMQIAANLLPLALAPSAAANAGKGKTAAGDQPAPSELPDAAEPSPPPANPLDFKTTPEDRAAMKASWNEIDWGDFAPTEPGAAYGYYEQQVLAKQAANPNLASIPVEDLAALYRYTTNAGNINKALRSGDPALIAPFEPSIKAIRSALNQLHKLGYDFDGVVFRSINQSASQIDTNWQIGTRIVDPGFVSTSTDSNLGSTFGNLRLKLTTNMGVDVSPLSMFAGEGEIMIANGSTWHITDGGFYKDSPANEYAYRELQQVTLLDDKPETSAAAAAQGSSPSAGIPDSPGGSLDIEVDPVPVPASKAAQTTAVNTSKWAKLGTAIGYAFDGLDIVGGVGQVVLGGIQIADGVKSGDNYEIASGSFNTLSGALSISTGIASLTPALAAAALPLAAAAFIASGIAGIIDFVNSLDDDEQFADKLEEMYGPLGILLDGWRKKAEDAYREAATRHINPNYQA